MSDLFNLFKHSVSFQLFAYIFCLLFIRVKIENATLKEGMESMEHLTSSIHRLRLSLLKVSYYFVPHLLKFLYLKEFRGGGRWGGGGLLMVGLHVL